MKKYDIKINYIKFNKDIMSIGWSAKNIGFGVLDIYYDKGKDTFYIRTEGMGKKFYEKVLEEAKEYLLYKSVIVE